MKSLIVKIKKTHPNATIPFYAKEGDAGLDLTCVSYVDYPNFREYDTGLAFEIPYGYVGYVFPRSSMSNTEHFMRNCVGVIDSGFRNSIKVRLTLENKDSAYINNYYEIGERIAQIVIMPFPFIELEEVDQLSPSQRGESGLGSSGR